MRLRDYATATSGANFVVFAIVDSCWESAILLREAFLENSSVVPKPQ